MFIYQEFHGDLHPGNVMVDLEAKLFLIDWGNSVDMKGKWAILRRYIVSVLSGDVETLAQTLIEMSTNQVGNKARYDEIKLALIETLEKKQVHPLGRDFALQLYKEGADGFRYRLQTAAQLMTNTYSLDMTIKSDYLHLSRSLFAMVGTYNNLYKEISGWTMARDFVSDCALFPLRYAYNRLTHTVIKSESNNKLINPNSVKLEHL
jgi:predicted unusual protein kinase regulating ubiquinone biosynthesis (AarF/ABC1/UbiB family)